MNKTNEVNGQLIDVEQRPALSALDKDMAEQQRIALFERHVAGMCERLRLQSYEAVQAVCTRVDVSAGSLEELAQALVTRYIEDTHRKHRGRLEQIVSSSGHVFVQKPIAADGYPL